MQFNREARRAVRRERALGNVVLAIDTLENEPQAASRQVPYRALRLVPIWSEDRRHLQGWEVLRDE
jgi:hypothetical protein